MTTANRGNKTNFGKEPADENKLNFCLAYLFAHLFAYLIWQSTSALFTCLVNLHPLGNRQLSFTRPSIALGVSSKSRVLTKNFFFFTNNFLNRRNSRQKWPKVIKTNKKMRSYNQLLKMCIRDRTRLGTAVDQWILANRRTIIRQRIMVN